MRASPTRRVVLAVLASASALGATAATAAGPPSITLPKGWSSTLKIGLTDSPGDAGKLAAKMPVGFRYQYLAGGVNTGNGWPTWNPNGTFASMYVHESVAAHLLPVFSYYQLLQSKPTAGGDELHRDLSNLRDASTMRAYYRDYELALKRSKVKGRAVVIHVEPDLWGYIEQAAKNGHAGTVPAAVASSGDPKLRGLPNTASGFARALVKLRDRLAPNVVLAWHLSVWGTKEDPTYSKPPLAHMDTLAAKSAAFYKSLHARFDVVFTDVADRDAGYDEVVNKDGGKSWWKPADYARQVAYIAGFTKRVRLGVVLWQVPVGNTVSSVDNDTNGHYRDNRVQWWLGDSADGHLKADRDAGVIAILFGGGASGDTCACDADHDGTDDDGGYLTRQVRAYVKAGELPLR